MKIHSRKKKLSKNPRRKRRIKISGQNQIATIAMIQTRMNKSPTS
jgi:hypothetical protein